MTEKMSGSNVSEAIDKIKKMVTVEKVKVYYDEKEKKYKPEPGL